VSVVAFNKKAQLSQRDRAMLLDTEYFFKSLKITQVIRKTVE